MHCWRRIETGLNADTIDAVRFAFVIDVADDFPDQIADVDLDWLFLRVRVKASVMQNLPNQLVQALRLGVDTVKFGQIASFPLGQLQGHAHASERRSKFV